jgi:hypothetical protein
LIYTFKEECVTRAKALESSIELDLHVNDIVEQAKESISQDATAIRMQTQNFIDKKNRLLLDAHTRCEAALEVVHSCMKNASKAYGDAYEEALNQQLKTVIDSTITEETLNQEMVIATNAHRDSIQRMTAIPPLVMEETRLQIQIRCAAAEEKAEDLQQELQSLIGKDSEGKIASLLKELGDLRSKLAKSQGENSEYAEVNESMNDILRRTNKRLQEKLGKVNSDNNRMKRAAQMDEDIMIGLKKKLETAESELESLKRKRTDSIRTERAITGILKRP